MENLVIICVYIIQMALCKLNFVYEKMYKDMIVNSHNKLDIM